MKDFEGKKITSGCVEVKCQSHAAKLRLVEVHIRNVFEVVIRDNKGEECIGKLTKKYFCVRRCRIVDLFQRSTLSHTRHLVISTLVNMNFDDLIL